MHVSPTKVITNEVKQSRPLTSSEHADDLEDAWMKSALPLNRLTPRQRPPLARALQRDLRRAAFSVRRRGGQAFTYLAVRSMGQIAPIPFPRQERINLVPFEQRDQRIPLRHMLVADRVPRDERCKMEPAIFGFQRLMSKVMPVDPRDIRELSSDLDVNVRRAMPNYYFNLPWVTRPQTPAEIRDNPNDTLAAVALGGPFAAYIEKTGDNTYVIDLSDMAKYQVRPNKARLGFKATLHYDAGKKLMVTDCIALPGEQHPVTSDGPALEWQRAQRIALATLSTHMTAVRHLAWTHIGVGEAFAAITATHLSATHPVHTILHPHNFRTTATNYYRVPSLISEESSALPSVFSCNKAHMLALLDDAAKDFDIAHLDPIEDAQRRGLLGDNINYPYLRNVQSIWEIMNAHVRDYIDAYYKTNDDVRQCPELQAWYSALSQVGGAHAYAGPLSKEALVKLITLVIFTASIEHENVGNLVVNYTTLPQIPSSVGLDGSLPTEAEYQEYINLMMLTSTPFDPLLSNIYPGMSAKGASVMTRMCDALKQLDAEMQKDGPLPLHTILPSKCAISAAT